MTILLHDSTPAAREGPPEGLRRLADLAAVFAACIAQRADGDSCAGRR